MSDDTENAAAPANTGAPGANDEPVTDADEEPWGFTLLWQDGRRNQGIKAEQMLAMRFDLASWLSFLRMRIGQNSYALMVMHEENGAKHKAKVVPDHRNLPDDASYDSIT